MTPSDPHTDLALIRRVIADSRRAVALDARPFVVWGALVIAGVGAERLAVRWGWSTLALWIVVIGIGWAFNAYEWRRRRWRGAYTFADRALGALWVGTWIAMSVLGFVGAATGALQGEAIAASLSAVLGLALFGTAALTDAPWGRLLALGWWSVAVVLYVWPGPHAMPLFAGAMAALMVAPGLWVRTRWSHRPERPVPQTSAGER